MSNHVKIGTCTVSHSGELTEVNNIGSVSALDLGFAQTSKGTITAVDLGNQVKAGNLLPLKMEFPEELAELVAEGLTNENALSSYSPEVRHLLRVLVNLGTDATMSNTDTQIAAAFDQFLGGLE